MVKIEFELSEQAEFMLKQIQRDFRPNWSLDQILSVAIEEYLEFHFDNRVGNET